MSFLKAKGAAEGAAAIRKGRELVKAAPYKPLLPIPSDEPVAMAGASQERGRADIFYLWGPGRVLGQRLQAWSAIVLLGSVFAIGAGSVLVMDRAASSRALPSVAELAGAEPQVRRPARRSSPQEGLIVAGRPYYPAMSELPSDYRPPSADRLAGALQGAASGATGTEVWEQLEGREVPASDFWSAKIPREGLLAQVSHGGASYALLGTYVSDTLPQIGGGASDRRTWPAVFIHRLDPDAEGARRSILYQLEAPLLAAPVSDDVALVSPEMAPDFWTAVGPGSGG